MFEVWQSEAYRKNFPTHVWPIELAAQLFDIRQAEWIMELPDKKSQTSFIKTRSSIIQSIQRLGNLSIFSGCYGSDVSWLNPGDSLYNSNSAACWAILRQNISLVLSARHLDCPVALFDFIAFNRMYKVVKTHNPLKTCIVRGDLNREATLLPKSLYAQNRIICSRIIQ